MSFLSSIFKKKKLHPYQPVNRLETLFGDSGRDPSLRPEFYRTLFHFDLLCLGTSKVNSDGSNTAQFQTTEFEGGQMIFAFTSEPALSWYLAKAQAPATNYIGFRAHTLFEMVQGKLGIILNPGHDCTKFFTPLEISSLLKDTNLNEYSQSVPAGESFMLGQPQNLPMELINALNNYLSRSDKVKQIYFGQLATKEGNLEYLNLVDFRDNVFEMEEQQVMKDLIAISRENGMSDKPINFDKLVGADYLVAIESGSLKAVSSYF